jgi:hypothetical protein
MNSASPPNEPGPVEYDPVFLHARKEAVIIFLVWLATLLWAVPYCYLNGYMHNVEIDELATVWGMPSWIFWGILVPWLVADVFTTWFCFWYMADDDLGEAPERARSTSVPLVHRDDSDDASADERASGDARPTGTDEEARP